MGRLEPRAPQDRQGRSSKELSARFPRSEKALVAALMEMYGQGVSTRRVEAFSEEPCGRKFSASTVSEINRKRDEGIRSDLRCRLPTCARERRRPQPRFPDHTGGGHDRRRQCSRWNWPNVARRAWPAEPRSRCLSHRSSPFAGASHPSCSPQMGRFRRQAIRSSPQERPVCYASTPISESG